MIERYTLEFHGIVNYSNIKLEHQGLGPCILDINLFKNLCGSYGVKVVIVEHMPRDFGQAMKHIMFYCC